MSNEPGSSHTVSYIVSILLREVPYNERLSGVELVFETTTELEVQLDTTAGIHNQQ